MGRIPSPEQYFGEIRQLLEIGEYQSFVKRLIDLSLDTEDILIYRRMVDLLDWLDGNQRNDAGKLEKLIKSYDGLVVELRKKIEGKKDVLIQIRDLSKTYTKSFFTLGPISFDISPGEIIGLVGENGNGKTTLLRLLCGELSPSEGTIDYRFGYKNKYDLRAKLVYIPQRTRDWHGSLLSNLRFTAASYGIKGEENLLLTELVIARMGLRRYRDFSWKNLSSGYKMRFELARMLLRKPELLLIDEPLANLDILAQQLVLDDFRSIAKSPFRPLGIVLSSQQLYEVEKTSDHVIFLKNGKPNNESLMDATDAEGDTKLIVEFESDWKHEQLLGAFSPLGIEKLQLGAGSYIAIFPAEVSSEDFLQTIVDNRIPLGYFRNISKSTRRFFLS